MPSPCIHVHPSPQECLGAIGVAVVAGEVQRRGPLRRRPVRVRPLNTVHKRKAHASRQRYQIMSMMLLLLLCAKPTPPSIKLFMFVPPLQYCCCAYGTCLLTFCPPAHVCHPRTYYIRVHGQDRLWPLKEESQAIIGVYCCITATSSVYTFSSSMLTPPACPE